MELKTLQFCKKYFTISIITAFSVSCSTTTPSADKSPALTITTPKQLQEVGERIKNDSTNPALYFARANYFLSIQDYNAAMLDLSHAMKIDSTRSEYYLALSDLYMFTNKTSKSKASLESCLRVDPKNTDAMLKLAELYFYVKKYQESVNYINEALKIDKYISKAYFLKGMNFKEQGDTAKAISSMVTATEQDQQYYAAYLQLGILYAAKKDRLALNYYDNALRIDPKSSEALYNKGKFYQDLKDWSSAISNYEDLLKIEPHFKSAHYNLGAIALFQNKYDEAIKHFTDAINDDPKYLEAYFARATTYMQENNKSLAKADYKMAAQIDPSYVPAQNALKSLGK